MRLPPRILVRFSSGSYAAWTRAILSVLGARSISAAAAFLCNVLVARQLGDARFAQFYLLFSIMTVVAGITGPAIDTTLVRFAVKQISAEKDGSLPYFKSVLYLKSLMLAITAVVCVALTPYLLANLFVRHSSEDEEIRFYYVYLAFAGGGIISLWGFAQCYLQSHQRFNQYAAYELGSSLLRLALVVVLILAAVFNEMPYLAVYVVAPLAMAVVSWLQLPAAVFRTPTSWAVTRELLAFGKWVFLATIFTTVVQRLDIVLLNMDHLAVPKSMVGRYSAALSIALAGELVLLTFFSVLLPKASALKQPHELRAFIGQFRVPSLLFCLALAVTIPLAGPFVRIVLGEQYEGTQYFFTIMILGLMVSLACAPPVTALYSLGHSGVMAVLEGFRLVLVVALGFWAIPRYGVWGMAVVAASVRAGASLAAYVVAHTTIRRAALAAD